MGRKSGDKSRYYRQRKKKLAKRVRMRALRKAAGAPKPASAPPAERAERA